MIFIGTMGSSSSTSSDNRSWVGVAPYNNGDRQTVELV